MSSEHGRTLFTLTEIDDALQRSIDAEKEWVRLTRWQDFSLGLPKSVLRRVAPNSSQIDRVVDLIVGCDNTLLLRESGSENRFREFAESVCGEEFTRRLGNERSSYQPSYLIAELQYRILISKNSGIRLLEEIILSEAWLAYHNQSNIRAVILLVWSYCGWDRLPPRLHNLYLQGFPSPYPSVLDRLSGYETTATPSNGHPTNPPKP